MDYNVLGAHGFRSRTVLCIVLTVIFIVGCASVHTIPVESELTTSKDTWNRYEPMSLNDIKAKFSHYPENFVGMTINAEATLKPYRIVGIYLGDLRQMSAFRKEFIRKWWGTMYGVQKEFTHLFESELLFEVEGNQYWMPVQNELIPYFQKELSKGDRVYLYIMLVGTIDHENEHEWMIIVNEFRKELPPERAGRSKTEGNWR